MKNNFGNRDKHFADHWMDRTWDVVVVGTGMGGATLGHALAKAGRSVLFIEKGRAGARDADSLSDCFPESTEGRLKGSGASDEELLKRGGRTWTALQDESGASPVSFTPFTGSGAGGSSALYGMALERFFSCDFQPRQKYLRAGAANLPEEWPLQYEQMAHWYAVAERRYRVCGGADPLRPRDSQLKDQAPPLTPVNQALFDYLQRAGCHPYQLPMACDFRQGDDRGQGMLTSNQARIDSATACLWPALEEAEAHLVTECELVRLEASATQIEKALCLWKGKPVHVQAKQYVLAAGGLVTPMLLFQSASRTWPQGLANGSGQLGRNLMRHYIDLYSLAPEKQIASYGPQKQLALNDFYTSQGGGFGTVQSFGSLPPLDVLMGSMEKELASNVLYKKALFRAGRPLIKRVVKKMLSGRLLVASILEDLPFEENCVSPGTERNEWGQRTLKLRYQVQAAEVNRIEAFRHILDGLFKPYRPFRIDQANNNHRIAHVCGTCRMGNNPKDSVVDASGRAHGIKNLYLSDASIFPTSGGVNPGLTIAALALRMAHLMLGRSVLSPHKKRTRLNVII